MLNPIALIPRPTRHRPPDLRASGDWTIAGRTVGRLTATVELRGVWWKWAIVWNGTHGITFPHASGVAADRGRALPRPARAVADRVAAGVPMTAGLARQAKRLPVPTSPTLTLAFERPDGSPGGSVVLDRARADDPIVRTQAWTDPSLFAVYVGGGYRVIVSRSHHQRHGRLLHASVSRGDGRLPGWYEVKAVKLAVFGPRVAAVVVLPEQANYVNIAEVMQIVQAPDGWGEMGFVPRSHGRGKAVRP